MRATVEGAEGEGYLSDEPPDPVVLGALVNGLAPLRPSRFEVVQTPGGRMAQVVTTSVGSPAEVLLELAEVKAAIRTWYAKQPDEILREASAYSARLTELWTELRLLEASDRSYTQLRTMQVTPVLEELDRQLKMNVSRIAMLRQDLDMATRGGGA